MVLVPSPSQSLCVSVSVSVFGDTCSGAYVDAIRQESVVLEIEFKAWWRHIYHPLAIV